MSNERQETSDSPSVVLVGRPGQRFLLLFLSVLCLAFGWLLIVGAAPIGIIDLGLVAMFSVFPAMFLIDEAQMQIRVTPFKVESRHLFFFWRSTEISQNAYWKKTRGGRIEIWEPGRDRRKYLFYPRFNYRVTISQALEILIPDFSSSKSSASSDSE